MNDSGAVEFHWLTTESVAPAVVAALTDAGVDLGSAKPGPVPAELLSDTDDAAFEPLLLIAGAAAIAFLAQAVSRIVRDHRQGGVVIDTRGPALTIRGGVRGVDAGTVIVVDDGGSQMLNAPEEKLLHQILKS
jgi:hypothetical protein